MPAPTTKNEPFTELPTVLPQRLQSIPGGGAAPQDSGLENFRHKSKLHRPAVAPAGHGKGLMCLLNVGQDAVQFIQVIVLDDQAALALGGVVNGDRGAQLFRQALLQAAHVRVRRLARRRHLGRR